MLKSWGGGGNHRTFNSEVPKNRQGVHQQRGVIGGLRTSNKMNEGLNGKKYKEINLLSDITKGRRWDCYVRFENRKVKNKLFITTNDGF